MPIPLPPKPGPTAIINTSHPLAAGVVRCSLYNQGSGSPLELVGGASGTLQGGAAWAIDADLGGVCLDTSAALAAGVNWTANGLSYGNSHCSIFSAARIPALGARQHLLVEMAGGATDGIFAGQGDLGQLELVLADVAALDIPGAMTVNHIYTMGYAFTRGTSVLFHARNQNTDVNLTGTVLTAATPVPSANPSVSCNRRNFSLSWGGTCALLYIWNRALSAAEFNELHDNPYAFITVPSTGGTGGDSVSLGGRALIQIDPTMALGRM